MDNREQAAGAALGGYTTSPVWDVRTLPPPSVSASQMPPISPIKPDQSHFSEEVANKQAEITVLRNRLKEMERDNLKLRGDAVQAKSKDAQNDQVRQLIAEKDQLMHELRFAKQDLISSKEESKRLRTSVDDASADVKAMRSEVAQTKAALASAQSAAAVAPPPAALPPAALPPAQAATSPSGSSARTHAYGGSPTSGGAASSTPPSQGLLPSPSRGLSMQWRQDVLLRELAGWEAASKAVSAQSSANAPAAPSSWFTLREAVGRLSENRLRSGPKDTVTNQDLAVAVAAQVRAAHQAKLWVVLQGAARFLQVLLGLFSETVSMLKSSSHPQGSSGDLFLELTVALHAAVLDSDEMDTGEDKEVPDMTTRHACVEQLLKTLLEVVGKLRNHELDTLGKLFSRPSLCALLVDPPAQGSLHIMVLQLLQGLFAGKELYMLSHGAENHDNLLLAVSNLLIIPVIESKPNDNAAALGDDTPELQECRVAALQVFCRCVASAPRLDMVLQLRGAATVDGETVETVLQRVVFLCHHELLCLGIHGVDGGSWHDPLLQECAKRRQRSIELALMIVSSFVWHAVPDMQAPNHAAACAEACAALGRMRPLVGSIVDMVGRRAAKSLYYTRLLSSASALRVLLAHAGGDESSNTTGDGGVALGNSRVSASRISSNLMVLD